MQDSPTGVYGRVAVADYDCGRRLRDVVDDIVSSNRDAPDATFSDSLAHLRRRRNHCGFSRGDNRCADAADNPARYRRSVVVDNGKAEKFPGSSGNTGSNSCAALVLLRFKLRTSEQNKIGLQNIETFVEFLPRPCRWGFQGWFTGSGLDRPNWLRLSPALTLVIALFMMAGLYGFIGGCGLWLIYLGTLAQHVAFRQIRDEGFNIVPD